jgi:hypothetical protein
VRVINKPAIQASFVGVTTSDPAPSTFAITNATQTPGLGGDTVTLQFSGAWVIESEAEDPANWRLRVNGQALDLTGSTFDLDLLTQILSVTLGSQANLHANFDLASLGVRTVADVTLAATPVAGAATGDVTPPNLVSSEQVLAQDAYGRTLEFTFDEAMDPVFSVSLASFSMAAPDLAVNVAQPTAGVLRVDFNNPVVPGVDTVLLTGLMDAHGNSFADQVVNITARTTVANGFASPPELVTVEGLGGDHVDVVFTQAIDPDDADDWTHWTLEAPTGVAVDLSLTTLDYDLLSRSLSIDLPADYATGDAFLFGPAVGNPPKDVDGEDYALTHNGVISGDALAPSIVSVRQNRTIDPTGRTFDVQFSEHVEQVTSETTGNWSVTGGASVTSAARRPRLDKVRLTLDLLALPGQETLGVLDVQDLAGNAMGLSAGNAIESTDVVAPTVAAAVASALEGLQNDTLVVTFDDDMLAAEVEDESSWTFESPVGNAVDVSLESASYDALSRSATLTFASGALIDLQRGDDFAISLAGMRDLGGNAVDPTPATGDVLAETRLPEVISAWVETAFTNRLNVRFSEPMTWLDDLVGSTAYTLRDSGGAFKGLPTAVATHGDLMGVQLEFPFAIATASDTLDVSGPTDRAGNALFTTLDVATEAQDPAAPALVPGSVLTTVSGESNDSISVTFDRRPSPWGLFDPSHWSVMDGPTPVDVSGARITWDGDLNATLELDGPSGPDLTTGTAYDVGVQGLSSAQGVAMAGTSSDSAAATGDVSAPDLPAGRARLDAQDEAFSLLIEMDEALDSTEAADRFNVDLNPTVADSVTVLGRRTVRATFLGGVTTADTVRVTYEDLAGNMLQRTRAVAAVDVSGPLVTSVQGVSVSGRGGDFVEVVFDVPVQPGSGLAKGNYTVTNGSPVSLAGATLKIESGTNTVRILLADDQELDPSTNVVVTVANVANQAGLPISPPANLGGPVVGDTTPPDFADAFVNLRQDTLGAVVDVRFDEDVDAAFVTDTAQWTVSGGQAVTAVEWIDDDVVRLTLSAPLSGGQTLQLNQLPDRAGNTSGAISIPPKP